MAEGAQRKTAVILFSLGGPDDQDSVKPFLFNLFRDPAIIALPGIARLPLAWLISNGRASEAKANYALMGGGSPLLPETKKQAAALKSALEARAPDRDWGVFIGMRYWEPYVADAAKAAREWGAEEVLLIPLYPQFSITTTGSSLTGWKAAWPESDARTLCCYPEAPGLAEGWADLIRRTWRDAGAPHNTRLLFSAHGLPEATVARGDPYPEHVARTVKAVSDRLPEFTDIQICYQSRVGPMKWIGPSTEDEITRAADEGKSILLCPIAFVSEHIETLVELDIEYRAVAEAHGAEVYLRAPAVGSHEAFIGELAAMTLSLAGEDEGAIVSGCPGICPVGASACPRRRAAEAEDAA